MKQIFTLILITALHSHGMSKMALIQPKPSYFQDIAAGIKEAKYDIKQNPRTYGVLAAVYVATSAATYYINPWWCAGMQFFGGSPIILSIPTFGAMEAEKRKRHYKKETFFAVHDGKFDEVTQFASKTSYDETDTPALQEQNTEFLFEALDKYSSCLGLAKPDFQAAYNYSNAALIFAKHHADVKKVSDVLKLCIMPHASKWLLDNGTNLKQN